MKQYLFFWGLLLIAYFAEAQSPAMDWHRCYGGSNFDYGYKAILLPNDEVVMVGSAGYNGGGDVIDSHDTTDFWVVRIKADNTPVWRRCWGGSGTDIATSVVYTDDNKLLVGGYSRTQNNGNVTDNHGLHDFWVVKMDTSQEFKWAKSYGGSENDLAYDMVKTSDGNYVLTGYSYSNDSMVSGNHGQRDVWVIKIDTAGTLLWQKMLGGSNLESANSVIEADNHDLLVVGRTTSNDGDVSGLHGSEDAWVVRLTADGNLIWQKCIGGSLNDQAKGICKGLSGGFWVCGTTNSGNGDFAGIMGNGMADAWVAKLDDNGNIVYAQKFGGTQDDVFNYITTSSDGNYLLTGASKSNDGTIGFNYGLNDAFSVKIEENGGLIWKSINGGSLIDMGLFIMEAWGGYLVMGYSYSYSNGLASQHGGTDIYAAKLSNTIVAIEDKNQSYFSLFPNPFQHHLSIWGTNAHQSMAIFDLSGKAIASYSLTQQQTNINCADLPVGMYYYQILEDNIMVGSGKLIKNE